jgi:hypothetical protein
VCDNLTAYYQQTVKTYQLVFTVYDIL